MSDTPYDSEELRLEMENIKGGEISEDLVAFLSNMFDMVLPEELFFVCHLIDASGDDVCSATLTNLDPEDVAHVLERAAEHMRERCPAPH